MSQSGRFGSSGGSGTVETLTGNTGGAVGPTGGGTINVVGDGSTVTVVGNPGTNTLTISATGGSGTVSGITPDSGTSPVIPDGSGYITLTGASTGLTFVGGTNTVTLDGTLSVANGGTGATSLTGVLTGNGTSAITANTVTQYAVLVGGASNAVSTVSGVGTSGQVLTSNGAGSNPTWQDTGSASISITGDSGGALTGTAFTFTGGTTGLTFAGASTTETLGGTLIVGNGGTGATSLTDHGVLIGSGTSAITAASVGTDGQVLVGATGADPAFATLTSSNGSVVFTPGANSLGLTVDIASAGGIDGVIPDSGTSPVVPDGSGDITLTGGTTGLTFVGSTNTLTLSGTVIVANGGTGATTFTAYAPICAGTTATGAMQSADTGFSTSGYIFTSNGSSALPSWQAPANPTAFTITAIDNTDSPYTVLSTDVYITVDCSSAAVEIDFPNAPATGRIYYVKDSTGSAATNNITLTTVGGSVTIDGGTTFVMNTNYEAVSLIFNGTSYEIW